MNKAHLLLACVCLLLAAAPAGATLTDGLIAYLPFEGDLTDAVGSYDGTDAGGNFTLGTEGGLFGGAAEKTTAGGAIEIPIRVSSAELTGSASFTITHWINSPANGGYGIGNKVSFDTGNVKGFATVWSGIRRTSVGDGTGGFREWYVNYPSLNTWTFEVIRFDADAPRYTAKTRYLGEAAWNGVGGWLLDPAINHVAGDLDSGNNLLTAMEDAAGYKEDDLAIWNRALSDAELDALFALNAPLSSLISIQPPPAHPGDANRDGLVNLEDFGLLKDHFGATAGATWEMGDFNADGVINLEDFGLLKDHFGHTAGDTPVTAVPEPASLITLAGIAALSLRRRPGSKA